jgi:hypothetical protein
MGASFTTEDGFTFRIHHTLYVDYGLEITRDGKELYYSPCCLSNDSYGSKPNPDKFDDWEEAEEASFNGDDDAFVAWDEADWIECLKTEADTLIEAFVPEEHWA